MVKVDWSDMPSQVGGGGFFHPVEGDNCIRVFTSPHQHCTHWIEVRGERKKFACAEDNCPACKLGHRSDLRFLVGVIDRASGAAKTWDMNRQTFAKLVMLTKAPEWGAPTGYDINVKVSRAGNGKTHHEVVPLPRSPFLLADETLTREYGASVDLAAMTKTPSPGEVRQRLADAGLVKPKPKLDDDFNFDDA